MVEHQGPRRHAAIQVIVGGQDVTNRLAPYLISVQVIDTLEKGACQANIELDDRDAQLVLPPDGGSMLILMGWAGEGPRVFLEGQTVIDMPPDMLTRELAFGGPGIQLVFSGVVSSVESGFGRRGGGRRVWVEGTSVAMKSGAKSWQQMTKGEGNPDDSQEGGGKKIKMEEVLQDAFKSTGLSVKLSPKMKEIEREAWHMNESPMNFLQRLADENGGKAMIANGMAIMVGSTEDWNVEGTEMPTIEAIWGVNLIGWRIRPYVARPQYSSGTSRFFKLFEGLWENASKKIGGGTPHGGADAASKMFNSVAGRTEADQNNAALSDDAILRRGHGWVLLNGEPGCRSGNKLMIVGARPGVDGFYKVVEVEHNYTRSVGFTTRCNVMYPQPTGNPWIGWPKRPDPDVLPTPAEVPPLLPESFGTTVVDYGNEKRWGTNTSLEATRWTQEQWENATHEEKLKHYLDTGDRPPMGITVSGGVGE